MRKQRERDTSTERALRSALHARGLRFRLHRRLIEGLRREADVVFPTQRVAVFVDGCFWHSCPQHATSPRANSVWWAEKLLRNVARDRETDGSLQGQGWRVVRVWEHTPTSDAFEEVVASLGAAPRA